MKISVGAVGHQWRAANILGTNYLPVHQKHSVFRCLSTRAAVIDFANVAAGEAGLYAPAFASNYMVIRQLGPHDGAHVALTKVVQPATTVYLYSLL